MDEWLKLIVGIILILVGYRLNQQNEKDNNFLSIILMFGGLLLALANIFDLLT